MKTYGTIALEERVPEREARIARQKLRQPPKPRRAIVVTCAPQVMARLKRVFAKVEKHGIERAVLPDTIETCRDLVWFNERYPLQADPAVWQHLRGRGREHEDRTAQLLELLDGTSAPREFQLAEPPRTYQRIAAEALLRARSLLLADDVGLGKTVSAICALTDPRTRPALVVTLTHLPRQWQLELARFAPGLRTHIINKGTPYDFNRTCARSHRFAPEGNDLRCKRCGISKDDAYHGRPTNPEVLIINYAKLVGWADKLAGAMRTVIFDEVQELRRDESERYVAASRIAEQADFRCGLSATPIYNYGSEMFSVLNVLAPDALGTREEFLREWCSGVVGQSGQSTINDPRAFGEFVREEGLMLRRTRVDVGRELPELSKVVHHVESDPAAIDQIAGSAAELAKFLLRGHEQKRGEKMQAAEEFSNVLRQATGIAKAPYVLEFVRLLVESGERVVLFGWHRAVYDLWLAALGRYGEDQNGAAVLYTGSETPKQKDEAREHFVAGRAKVLIMSLRSGAGLDGLQGCCRTVVFGELDWSPGVIEQCIGRVHRDGQQEPVVAYLLVSDHGADPVMADVLGVKRSQSEAIRDPKLDLVEKLEVDVDRVKKLAESFLAQRSTTEAA